MYMIMTMILRLKMITDHADLDGREEGKWIEEGANLNT